MVDLRLPKPTTAVDEMPQSRVSANDVYRSGMAVAKGMADVGQAAEDVGVEFAKREGAASAEKAVHRNPDGSLTVETPETSFLVGKIGEAYRASQSARLEVALRSEAETNLADMARKYQTDPQGFRVAAGAYVDARKEALGGTTGEAAWNYGQKLVGQYYGRLVDGQAQRDVSNGLAEIEAREKLLVGHALALASQNGTDTPEYKDVMVEIGDIRRKKAANPLYGYTPELHAVAEERLTQQVKAQALTAIARDEALKSGNPAAAIAKLGKQIAGLGVPPAEQAAYFSQVNRAVTGIAAVRAENLANLRQEADVVRSQIATGGKYDDAVVDSMAAEFRRNRAFGDANTLLATRDLAHLEKIKNTQGVEAWVRDVTDLRRRAEAVSTGADPKSLRARPGVDVSGISADTRARVSSLQQMADQAGIPFEVSSGFRDPAHNARVGGAKHSQHMDGNAVDIVLPKDPEQARKLVSMLAGQGIQGFGYYPNSNSIHIDFRQSGAATWGTDYTSGSVGKGGDPEIWKAIQSRDTTLRPSSPAGPAADPVLSAVVTATAKRANEFAKDALDGIEEAEKLGVAWNPQDVQALDSLGNMITDKDLRQKAATLFAKATQGEKFNALPVMEQDRIARASLSFAKKVGVDAVQRSVLQSLHEKAAANLKAVKEDPVSYGLTRDSIPEDERVPQALNFQQPGAIAAALGKQQRLLNLVRRQDEIAPKIALTKPQIDQFKANYDASTPEERGRILGEMASALDGETLRTTLAKVVSKDESATVMAGAGVIMKQNPPLGQSIIRGEAAMAAGTVKPLKDNLEFRSAFQSILSSNDLPAKQIAAIQEIATARYADLSLKENDTTGQINSRRLTRAVNDVTGGVISYGGRNVIAPWPGATYSDFREAIRSIKDEDVAGAMWKNGTPADAASIKAAKFFSVADGVYGVYVGSGPDQGWMMRKRPDGGTEMFTLNLGAKRPRS